MGVDRCSLIFYGENPSSKINVYESTKDSRSFKIRSFRLILLDKLLVP